MTKLAQLGKEIWSETVFQLWNLATSLPIQNCSPYGTLCDVTLYIFFSIVLFPTFDLRKPEDTGGFRVSHYHTYLRWEAYIHSSTLFTERFNFVLFCWAKCVGKNLAFHFLIGIPCFKNCFLLSKSCFTMFAFRGTLMQIMGLLDMYFDTVVVEVEKCLHFFTLAVAILCFWDSIFRVNEEFTLCR